MESDWHDLVSRILEAIPADKLQEMGETVMMANTGVRRRGIGATVLGDMASAREEGSDVPDVMMPG